MSRAVPTVIVALLLASLPAPTASAEFELYWGGRVQSDIRFRIQEKETGDYWQRFVLPVAVDRNENIFKLKLEAAVSRFAAVVDVDLVALGYTDSVQTFGDLSLRNKVDPFRIEFHNAFIEATDIFFDGLDLRIGMQKLLWGQGDQFNPTNVANADDLEDPLLFGEQQANLMVRVDYTPFDELSMTAALIPVFRTALLPPSGMLGLAMIDRIPVVDLDAAHRLVVEQRAAELPFDQSLGYPTVVSSTKIDVPDLSLDNMQFAFQLQTTLLDQDIGISYYYGRNDFPVPIHNHSTQVLAEDPSDPKSTYLCDPNDPDRCISGLIQTETTLGFPRMQMIGLNMAGELDLLGWISDDIEPIGYRLEVGIFFPRETVLTLSNDPLQLWVTLPFLLQDDDPDNDYTPFTQPGGEYDYGDKGPPLILTDEVFAKWSLGLDYTFGEHVYLNVQWVHGMVDEFGAGDFFREDWTIVASDITTGLADTIDCALPGGDPKPCAREWMRPRIADYLVAGVDLRFMNQALLIRLFTIWYLNGVTEERWDEDSQQRVRRHFSLFTEEGFSAVIFPQVSYNFGYGFELSAGALLQLGTRISKFGDPAAGGSVAWMQGRYSF